MDNMPMESMGSVANEANQIQTLVKQELGLSSGSDSVLMGGRGALPDLEILK